MQRPGSIQVQDLTTEPAAHEQAVAVLALAALELMHVGQLRMGLRADDLIATRWLIKREVVRAARHILDLIGEADGYDPRYVRTSATAAMLRAEAVEALS